MSESFIEPDSLNSTLLALGAVVDENGSTRFINKELASYNFDGMIPTSSDTILVNELEVGMSFLPIGETEGSLKTVIKIDFDDPEMTGSPTNDYIISYLGTNGEIETVVYDGGESIEVYFEDWDDKVLGDNGWIITQEGNAIFSNVAVRGRIEATEGFIDGDLIVTGSLSTSETADTDGGVVFDSTGILAYDTDGNNTFWLDATTGDITIFGTPGDDLLTGEDVGNSGTTVISGNRITTGTISSNNFNGTANGANYSTTGMAINLTDGSITSEQFRIDTSGNAYFAGDLFAAGGTFEGTLSAVDGTFTGTLSAVDGTFEGTLSAVDGTFEGDVIGGTFKSNLSITANSGDGVYLDDFGQVRFSDPDATLTFNANGLTITNNANTSNLTFNSSGLSLSGTGLSITGADIYLTGGSLISDEFSIDSLGNATFSGDITGANINLTGGSLTSTEFSIDSAGNATFSGELSSGISITSPIITGGRFTSRSINNQTISIGESVPGWIYNAIAFLEGGNAIWRQALTTGGDILFSRVDGSSNFYVSVNGRIQVTGANGRFEGNASGLQGTANNLIAKNIADYTINQNLGTTSGVEFGNVNINNMTAGQGTHFVHWNNTGTPGAQYRLSRTTSTSLASSINIKSYIEKIDIDEDLLDHEFYPVKFKYNVDVDEFGDDAEYRIGIIAEEMNKIPTVKSLVQYDENNEPVGFDYQKLALFLVPIMKKQKDKIKNLEDRIERLEKEILNG